MKDHVHCLTFSVIICTKNRADYLANVIRSLQTQVYPRADYEIIVVDNGSIDHTKLVVEQANLTSIVPVKYIYEPQLGKSKARNTGVSSSKHDILAFIDDDAIADQYWLARFAAAFEGNGERTVCVAGKSEVVLEEEKPDWFPSELRSYLSGTEHLGNAQRHLKPGEYPVLANLSIRRRIFIELGGFAEELKLYNEEIELCRRIRKNDWEIFYAPEALVQHHISKNRLTFKSLLWRSYWQGFSDVLTENRFSSRSWSGLLRSNAALVSQMLSDGVKTGLALVRGQRKKAILHLNTMIGRYGRFRAQLELI